MRNRFGWFRRDIRILDPLELKCSGTCEPIVAYNEFCLSKLLSSRRKDRFDSFSMHKSSMFMGKHF